MAYRGHATYILFSQLSRNKFESKFELSRDKIKLSGDNVQIVVR